MTPLEAAQRLTAAIAQLDTSGWSSEDIAERDKLRDAYFDGIAQALVEAAAKIKRLDDDLSDVAAAHQTEVRMTAHYRSVADKLMDELAAIDRIAGSFGDPEWNGKYISAGLIARRVQDAAMLWQRDRANLAAAEERLALLRERLAQIETATEEMLREES